MPILWDVNNIPKTLCQVVAHHKATKGCTDTYTNGAEIVCPTCKLKAHPLCNFGFLRLHDLNYVVNEIIGLEDF